MALSFDSYFSSKNEPFDQVKWVKKTSSFLKPGIESVEFPDFWSQSAVDITVSRYFRKSGVPAKYGKNGSEVSLKNLIMRVTQTIAEAGTAQGYFKTQNDRINFEKDLRALIVLQKASFNSPVWFNCGLFHKYGIAGGERELYSWNAKTQKIDVSERSYESPQLSACFIQSVKPNLEDVKALALKEKQLFKYGSGSGTNFSTLPARSEVSDPQLNLISVLEELDRGAALVKSGGVARRAAKMVLLDIDHPEVLPFILWKKQEEKKLRELIRKGEAGHFESDAFNTLTGQNSNNSLRVSDKFIQALREKKQWELKSPLTKQTLKTLPAEELWRELCQAAWECADPGIQFSDTIEKWNTCKASGSINASNPCSEYVFLDETACNLASINLSRFYSHDSGFDFQSYRQAVRILLVAQDILIDFAGYPTQAIARRSHEFRTLGLGFANLGGLFMRMGFSYDSQQALEWTQLLTASLQSVALNVSQEMSKALGSFQAFTENKVSYLEVLNRHQTLWEEVSAKITPAKDEQQKISQTWQSLIDNFNTYGFRNAQVTAIAPTGTIGLFMDCETTGIEPEYSLIRYKQLSGGGSLKFVNQAVADALKNLGYSVEQVKQVIDHLLKEGELESAPHIKAVHLSVFDCCYPGAGGKRRLSWQSQVDVVAAAQKFISGAISKTVNLPPVASSQDVSDVYLSAFKMGIKALSVYREGSKASQPVTLLPASLPLYAKKLYR